MPARNLIKFYLPNSIYHIYNRGVEKRIIFNDDQDYNVFLSYIKEYVSPEPQGVTLRYRDLHGKYYEKIKLLAFCLMPNHFHLLIKQTEKDNIKKFTQSLFTRYTMYFNHKYKRIGGLFQSTYKATNVIDKEHLLYVSKYIHRNPTEILKLKNLTDAYSSYSDYLGLTNTSWLDKTIIQDEFSKSSYIKYHNIKNYKYFVEVYKDDVPQYDLF